MPENNRLVFVICFIFVVILVMAGCQTPPKIPEPTQASEPTSEPTSASSPADAQAPAPEDATTSAANASPDAQPAPVKPLPPGVLAEAQGLQGVIRVEEADGLRLLTITSPSGARTVHAAVSRAPGALVAADPVSALLSFNRPKAKRALVIGLGSGRSAADLAALGLEVEAVELEPAVIDFARAWFDYKGAATAAEGASFLTSYQGPPFDVILLDAFNGHALPAAFLSPETTAALKKNLTKGGILFVRLLASPTDPALFTLTHLLNARHSMVLGSGAGSEPQNLLVVASEGALSAVIPPEAALWPVRLPADVSDAFSGHPSETHLDPSIPQGVQGVVTLTGYLIRLPDGELALDLPHWHMGARRYVINAPPALNKTLSDALPPKTPFPTSGDIGSDMDGELSDTLQHLLGGGGVKRSQLRFSPVAASVRGKARLRAIIGPDDIFFHKRPDRPPEGGQIPYGGILYDLEVSELLWTLDNKAWQALRKKHLTPSVKKATAALTASALKTAPIQQAHDLLRAATADLCAALASCEQLVAIKELQRLIPAPTQSLDPWEVAVSCDTAQHGHWSAFDYDTVNPDARTLGWALLRCAQRHYLLVAKDPKSPHAVTAIARLLSLADQDEVEAPIPFPAVVKPTDLKKLMGPLSEPPTPLDTPPPAP